MVGADPGFYMYLHTPAYAHTNTQVYPPPPNTQYKILNISSADVIRKL